MQLQTERKSSSRPCQSSPIKDEIKKIALSSPDALTASKAIFALADKFGIDAIIAPALFQITTIHKNDENIANALLPFIPTKNSIQFASEHVLKAINFCHENVAELQVLMSASLMSDLTLLQSVSQSSPTNEVASNSLDVNLSKMSPVFVDPFSYAVFQNESPILVSAEVIIDIYICPIADSGPSAAIYFDYKLEQSVSSSPVDFSISNFSPYKISYSNSDSDEFSQTFQEVNSDQPISSNLVKTTKKQKTSALKTKKRNLAAPLTHSFVMGQLIYNHCDNRLISSNVFAFGGGRMKKPQKLDPLKELRNMKRPVQKDLDVRTVIGINSLNTEQKASNKTKEVVVYEKPAKPVIVAHPERIKNAVDAFRKKHNILVPASLKERALALSPKKDPISQITKEQPTIPAPTITANKAQEKNTSQKEPQKSPSSVIIVKPKQEQSGMSIQINAIATPTQRLLNKSPTLNTLASSTVSSDLSQSVSKTSGNKKIGPNRGERTTLLFSQFASKKSKPKN